MNEIVDRLMALHDEAVTDAVFELERKHDSRAALRAEIEAALRSAAPKPAADAQDAARYRWHRKENPMALLHTAWGKSKAACEIGGDCDAATDAAMAEQIAAAKDAPIAVNALRERANG